MKLIGTLDTWWSSRRGLAWERVPLPAAAAAAPPLRAVPWGGKSDSSSFEERRFCLRAAAAGLEEEEDVSPREVNIQASVCVVINAHIPDLN